MRTEPQNQNYQNASDRNGGPVELLLVSLWSSVWRLRVVRTAVVFFCSVASRLKLLAPGIVFAALFLWSCGIGSSATNTPSLRNHHLGALKINQSISHEFSWTNDTFVSIRIKAVTVSCECVEVKSFTPVIPPRGVGHILVTATPRTPGLVEWMVYAQLENHEGLWYFALSASVSAAANSNAATGRLVHISEVLNGVHPVKDWMLVDVRSQDMFRQAHIPGSINVPLFALKARGFLRARQVVLLNEGHHAGPLLEEAVRLNNLGFESVGVLDGGVREWQLAGGLLEGESTNSSSLATISAQQFFNARAEPGWLVIATQNDSTGMLPANQIWDFESVTVEKITNAIRQHTETRRILLVTPDGEGYRVLNVNLNGFHSLPLFYLEGGTAAFVTHFTDQLAQQHRRIVTISSQQEQNARFSNGARAPGQNRRCCGGS